MSGDKKFVFPDAFKKYLTLTDQRAADFVNQILQEKEQARKQKKLELEQKRKELEEEKALQREQQRLLELKRLIKNNKFHPRSQIAFWFETQDKDKVFTEWKAFAGVVKSGAKKGQPNRPIRLKHNSACLITTRAKGMPEKDRRILGVYMVKEHFTGKQCKDGYVPAHSKYRLQLSEQESKNMLFWNYYVNEKYPHNMTWNSGNYRYFDNVWMAQILKDIISLKKDPQEKELAQEFFNFFCKINRIEEKEIKKPNGALMQIKE